MEANANQLYLTGTVVLHKDVNLVVVEGGKPPLAMTSQPPGLEETLVDLAHQADLRVLYTRDAQLHGHLFGPLSSDVVGSTAKLDIQCD